MSRSDRVFSGKFDNQFNLTFYALFAISIIGIVYLAVRGVDAGTIYAIGALAGIASVFLATVFIKGDDLGRLTQYVKIPFSQSLGLSSFFLLLGFAVPVFFKLLVGAVSKYSIVQLSIPLYGNQINTAFQSFSTAQISSNISWQLFTTSWSAGILETLMFSWAFVILFSLVGLWVWNLSTTDSLSSRLFGLSKKYFILGFALLVNGLLFVGAHTLNTNYVGFAFVGAFLFLMLSNISIYFWGVFLVFWVGYHIMNNFLYLVDVYGWSVIFQQGLLSWFGLFFVGILLLLVFFVFRNWSKISVELRGYFRS